MAHMRVDVEGNDSSHSQQDGVRLFSSSTGPLARPVMNAHADNQHVPVTSPTAQQTNIRFVCMAWHNVWVLRVGVSVVALPYV